MTKQDEKDFLCVKKWMFIDPETLMHKISDKAPEEAKKAFKRLKQGALMFE